MNKIAQIAEAFEGVLEAERKLRKALNGVSRQDLQQGLGRKPARASTEPRNRSSADELAAALKSRAPKGLINVHSAFFMMPAGVRARLKEPRKMAAAIRVLHQRGILARGTVPGTWRVVGEIR